MKRWLRKLDRTMISEMHTWSVDLLRIALSIVFIWFGALKVLGVTPVFDFIAETVYFLDPATFIPILGFWELIIGVGLLLKLGLRGVLALMWLQLLGTFMTFIFRPDMLFSDGNILLLTVEGEFVIKNLVLIAAGLVVGGFEIKAHKKSRR